MIQSLDIFLIINYIFWHKLPRASRDFFQLSLLACMKCEHISSISCSGLVFFSEGGKQADYAKY